MKHTSLRGLAAALMLAVCSCAFASYPKHMSVTSADGRTVTVTAVADGILKVTNTAAGEQPRKGRVSVIDESTKGPRLNADGSGMSANLCGVSVSLTRDGVLTIDAGKGKRVTDSGLRTTDAAGRRVMALDVDSRGAFYGAGERGHKLNLRGDTLVMYNRQNYGYTGSDPRISQMNITMPLFVASDGYAIVFDDFAPAQLVLGNPIKYITESHQPVSWYFVNGANTLADVSEALTRLTGRQELPPMWSLGYITSKYGYHNQAETLGVVDTLKTAGYPVDGLVLDLYWYGKEQDMGRWAWDPQQWPDPKGMLANLKNQGINVITITQPYVLRNGRAIDNYKQLAAGGMLMADSTGRAPQEVKIWVGEGGMFDVSNPKTRQWMANRYKQLTDLGVTGWWGDLGEPEVHPETGLHANGLTARQYHNQYGNDWSGIVYNMFKDSFPQERLVSMMRGGTTGLQRYDVFPWSTDVSRSWGGLEPQIRIMLNSGLSGLGYMGHDVGGFAVGEVPTDPELYVRWLQLGLFSPMLRTHAQFNAEPYHYPEYADIIKPLVLERYRWLPYNYTLAWENATKGYPLVRPLNYHSPLGTDTQEQDLHEFLWGRDVLVAPVMEQGAVKRNVTLPAGSRWVDMSAPTEYYEGGTTIADYPAPLSKLPLFVREGAFIPMADYPMGSTMDYDPDRLTVQYYPSASELSSFTMFEDDFRTPSTLSHNQGRLITMTGDARGNTTAVSFKAEGQYPGMDPKAKKQITLVVNNQTSKPRKVTVNGRGAKYVYNAQAHTVTVTLGWKTDRAAEIRIIK